MRVTDQQIKDAVMIRDEIIRRMDEHYESIKVLEKNLSIIDAVLKGSSFTKASEMGMAPRPESMPGDDAPDAGGPDVRPEDSVPIKRDGTGDVIARVYQVGSTVRIVPEVEISQDAEPFGSFFVGKVVGDMRRKDEAGGVEDAHAARCSVDADGRIIRQITVDGCGNRERLNEIISTAGWTLNRMLEKAGG